MKNECYKVNIVNWKNKVIDMTTIVSSKNIINKLNN